MLYSDPDPGSMETTCKVCGEPFRFFWSNNWLTHLFGEVQAKLCRDCELQCRVFFSSHVWMLMLSKELE